MLRLKLLSRNITGQLFNQSINHHHCNNSIESICFNQQQQIRSICCSTSITYSFNNRIISEPHNSFMTRHIGPRDDDKIEMLKKIGFNVSYYYLR